MKHLSQPESEFPPRGSTRAAEGHFQLNARFLQISGEDWPSEQLLAALWLTKAAPNFQREIPSKSCLLAAVMVE